MVCFNPMMYQRSHLIMWLWILLLVCHAHNVGTMLCLLSWKDLVNLLFWFLVQQKSLQQKLHACFLNMSFASMACQQNSSAIVMLGSQVYFGKVCLKSCNANSTCPLHTIRKLTVRASASTAPSSRCCVATALPARMTGIGTCNRSRLR